METAIQLCCGYLDNKELCNVMVLSKLWKQLAGSIEAREAALKNTYQVAGIVTPPRYYQLYQTIRTDQFVRCHRIQRGDNLMLLALKHGCDLFRLKRFNNIMSDSSLASRRFVYVQVKDMSEVKGNRIYFKFDTLLQRDLAVVLHPGEGVDSHSQPQAVSTAAGPDVGRAAMERLSQKLLCSNLLIDLPTAKFYLEESGWDVNEAMRIHREMICWEGNFQHRQNTFREFMAVQQFMLQD